MKKLSIGLFVWILGLSLFADPGVICLRDNTIDPASPKLQSQAEPVCFPTASGQYQFIVQPAKNFSVEETKQIEGLGIKFIGTVPPNAYIVLASREELGSLKERFSILFSCEYLPEYKMENKTKLSVASKDEPFRAAIMLASKEQYQEVVDYLKADGLEDESFPLRMPAILEAEVTEDLANRLCRLSAILDVDELSEIRANNDVAKKDFLMNVEKPHSAGYTGKGVVVGIVDSGLDSGDTNNLHPDFINKKYTAMLSRGSSQNGWYDLQGHGTHVTGSAVGTGAHENGKYAGVAPDADLFFICIGNGSSKLCYLQDDDILDAYNAGTKVVNNSWGDSTYTGDYTYNSVWGDELAHTYPDMLLVFSVGNENDDVESEYNISIHSFGVCKNVLSVAAAESCRPECEDTYGSLRLTANDFFRNELAAYPADGKNQGMACFSSRGPCRGGRMKPDICAPGTMIYSTVSYYDYDSGNYGNRNIYYKYLCGTSMAAPLVTGACADILQFLKANGVKNPSSALVKAVAINGARSMGKGQYEGYNEIPDRTPNNVNGYGHIDLEESINPKGGILLTAEATVTNTGDTITFPCSKVKEGPVRITLCWNDPPGSAGAVNALVNDLDLVVFDGENTYYAGGASEHSDYKNNVEQFQMEDFPAGNKITVSVRGFNVMQGPQAFALAVSGLDEIVPEPAFAIFALLFSLILIRKK